MEANKNSQGHPKGLYVLFITEMWERFSYYGMRALFVLFMTKALFFDKDLGSQIYGSYTGLVYLTPLIGGYVADRYWGNRKSIIIGGILMAAGQFFMFMSGTLYSNASLAPMLMFIGLGLLIFGNGFFKPNISTMVGQLYEPNDKRVDSAFTIFYMGINLGAFVAPLVAGFLGDTGRPEDFRWGFLAACFGMILSVLLFVFLKDKYIVTPDGRQIGTAPNSSRDKIITEEVPVARDVEISKETVLPEEGSETLKNKSKKSIFIWLGIWVFLLVGLSFLLKDDKGGSDWIGAFIFSLTVAAPGFIISDPSLSKIEKQRIWVIFIVAFFVIFFWAAFEQAGASLTYFAEEQTQRVIDLNLSTPVLLGLCIAVILLSVYLVIKVARIWLNKKGWPVALMIYIALAGVIYMLINAYFKSIAVGYISITEIPASAFQSVNAIAIVVFAPLFALLWTLLSKKGMEPASPYKQSIGLFLLAVGYLVIAFGVKGLAPGVKVSMLWLIGLYTIHTFGELCLSPIGLSMVNKLAPLKFASLLMGVWFLSTAAANKFAGELSKLYPQTFVALDEVRSVEQENSIELIPATYDLKEGTKEIDNIVSMPFDKIVFGNISDVNKRTEIRLQIEKNQKVLSKNFLGFEIATLYDFFMIFVFMAGVASIILFFLSKKLVTMMHGVR